MKPVYSHSRLSSYERCPKRFQYRYVLRVPPDGESIEAFLGKRVHEVLERLYRFVARGLVPTLEQVVRRYRALWHEAWDAERITIARNEYAPAFYLENGERCVRNHYVRHYPFDRDQTLALEHRVAFRLDDSGQYRMQGVIDRLARAPDGAVEIHDFKTSGRLPRRSQLDADRQLALYQIGVRDSHAREIGEAGVRLVWHYLLFDRVCASTRTPEQIDAIRADTIATIDRIEDTREFQARPGPLCAWCEYRARCPASAHRPASRPPAPEPPALAMERRPRTRRGRPASTQLALFPAEAP